MVSVYIKINEVFDYVKEGRPIIIVDASDREDEGDIFVAAEKITAETLDFMLREARGNICVPITFNHAQNLGLKLQHEEAATDPAICRTLCEVDYVGITGNGVTYNDRIQTIMALSNPMYSYANFKPGHTRPLRADTGGLATRRGHTEASVELARISGCFPAAVICEMVGSKGEMLRGRELEDYSRKMKIPLVTIADLVEYYSRER